MCEVREISTRHARSVCEAEAAVIKPFAAHGRLLYCSLRKEPPFHFDGNTATAYLFTVTTVHALQYMLSPV
jgi:hypothetical protein